MCALPGPAPRRRSLSCPALHDSVLQQGRQQAACMAWANSPGFDSIFMILGPFTFVKISNRQKTVTSWKKILKYIQIHTNVYKIYKIYTEYRTGARGSGPDRAAAAWSPRGILYIPCIFWIYLYIFSCIRIYFSISFGDLTIFYSIGSLHKDKWPKAI